LSLFHLQESNKLLSPTNRLLVSLAILSSAIISYQIILMQVLSIVQWYHFAYMIISVALLGFAAAGTLLTFIKEWALRNFNLVIPTLMISCGLLMGLVMVLAQSQQIQFDSYLIFSDKQQQLRLFISYILYFIPFFTGALAIGLIFIKRVEHIGKFYFANLLGSGAGGILALGMISSFMPATLSALAGMLPVMAGLFITTSRFSITRIYAILSLLILVFLFLYPPKLSLSQLNSQVQNMVLIDCQR